MSLIHVDKNSASQARTTKACHLMPCEIDYNGPAKVADYFDTSVRHDQGTVLSATFRGRPLSGKEMQLPDGYTGLLLKELHRPYSEEEERHLKVSHKFEQFTYWNLDAEPSINDKIHKALEWTHIAKTLHSPIESQENSNVSEPDK
ncbi:ribonuclease H2 subunit C [Lingula anatina]|uniref:Ribonuclease H2 subunit C n=1 Tax=Lingula anatina TaxID=7574 RepID=A0A1S3IH94_LINAN|nr:ribonuclease H2 subunit C [Lingula anatina]|eukprot:XP_013397498.1 ribonuclease H2 subunit C [Lingula anatina]